MSYVRIIHISDLHLESEQLPQRKVNIIGALINDLKTYINSNTIIAFTGDLIDKGGSNFSDKDKLFENARTLFIDNIIKEFPTLKTNFFIVPGNHDVLRDKINPFLHKGLIELLKNNDTLNNFISDNYNGSTNLESIQDYKKFEESFYQSYANSQLSFFDSSFRLTIGGINCGISCFNSAFLCKDSESDFGKLSVGEEQINKSLSFIKDVTLKIALIHHPFEFLKETEKEPIRLCV